MAKTQRNETQKQSMQANSEYVSQAPQAPRMVFLKDLNLLDRFLFDEVMDDHTMHQLVLQIILHEDIHLMADSEVEKQLQTAPYLKSVRLDVFGVGSEGAVYNTEMQQIKKSDLQKRSRFYQGLIDSGLLAACEEALELKLEDGATRIFLNTKGTNPDDVGEELVEFLKYVEQSNDVIADNRIDDLKKSLVDMEYQKKLFEEYGIG